MMTREEVLQVIVDKMRINIDDIEDTEIDPKNSIVLYGPSSLDIVEIVSSSMRELKIRVPRTKMIGLENINGLVDLFCEYLEIPVSQNETNAVEGEV